jgi:predicted kinase
MLGETVRQAIEKRLIKSRTIIVDATHSKSSAKQETPTQILRRLTKQLRKELYCTQFELSEKFPEKPEETADLNNEIEYSKKLVETVKQAVTETGTGKAKNALAKVEALLENDKIKEIQSIVDEDAKLGFKSEHNSFFGYKTHLAMTEERIITGLEVTTGESHDGEYLEKLINQSEKNGITVEEIVGDAAYSSKSNLEYTKEKSVKLISRLNTIVSNGIGREAKGFIYNKDADMFQCPAGHLSIRKAKGSRRKETKGNTRIVYFYDIEKCARCPMREGCYKSNSKKKTYSITILSETHKEQEEFQKSEYFKERAKQRYMIEAKNAELKQAHGLEKADSKGIKAMRLQSYFTAFVVNTKRILKLAS